MKTSRVITGSLVASLLFLCGSVSAQVNRPYRNGSVWTVAFIKMKPGMETAYLTYIATEWKREQKELKRDGQIISYKVLQTESHATTDWNLMLLTEFKDLATMEANEAKADALIQRVIGNDDKQREGYRERLEIREVMGDRLAREIILEPRQ